MKLIMENWRRFVKEAYDAKKADRNKDGETSEWEEAVGKAAFDEEELEEDLIGGQKNLDKNKNGKIDGADFKLMDEDEDLEEGFSGNGPLTEPIEEKKKKRKKKKPCKPAKGKRFAKRVNGKCRSFGQKGKAKGGGDRIRPGTKKGDAYCARSAKIKKCKNPPCANALSRKKWKCRGTKSVAE